MKTLEQISRPVADELTQFEAFFSQTLRADSEPMDSIMRYVGNSQGKRLRPILVLLSAKLFGEVNECTLRAATFVEMMHSATLIHDDVVDDADIRRGRASVKAQWDSRSAVLAGDYLLAKAMLLLNLPDDHRILQEMLLTSAAMSEGELIQNASSQVPELMVVEPGQSTEGPAGQPCEAYLEIITRKTATLMRACCTAGALSVDASPKDVNLIANFGLHFGILFQLRDDILDGENTEQAQALLPEYQQKALDALKPFPASETLEALHELTVFCGERNA